MWSSITHNPPTITIIKNPDFDSSKARSASMSRLTNVCFTLNNPEEPLLFDPTIMSYLIYQLELSESGTPHFQGYMELKKAKRLPQIKTMLDSATVHIEPRRGSAQEASDYCCKDDTYVPGGQRLKYGTMKVTTPGKRNDIKEFKELVMSGTKRKRDMVESHPGIIARHNHFYDTLTLLRRPASTPDCQVILHYGATGLGKTRKVMDAHLEDESFYVAPLSNSTLWYDTYDGHETVLIDDFAGAASHMSLVALLRLLDIYPLMVPVKGSHTWWRPKTIYVTTNILPCDWYKWEARGSQYLALSRRFTSVVLFYPKLFAEDPGYVEQGPEWWKENAPDEALLHYS